MENTLKLSRRLLCAAAFIREGAFLADVGTDHAYLPIALCLEGKLRGAVASDINEGPVERAKENIKKYGLDGKITVRLSDGLRGIEEFSPDHVAILGMGGELIARILSDAPWVKSEKIRLCLQPMTHPELLREYLSSNGFFVADEEIVEEDGKIYQLILAVYSGKGEEYGEEELLLGKINIRKGGDSLRRLGEWQIAVLNKRIEGKAQAGADASVEKELIEKIKRAVGASTAD